MAKQKSSGGKQKSKDSGSPWVAAYGVLGAAVVLVMAALLGAARWQWQRRSQKVATVAGGGADSLMSAEEQIKRMGHSAELQGKIDDIIKAAAKLEVQREAAEKEKEEMEKVVADSAAQPSLDEGLGPGVMAAQRSLISRLLEMVQEVDALRGEERLEERLAVSGRVERELQELEEQSQEQKGSIAVQKQQTALIGLVRKALQSDRDGETIASDEDWNDEGLLREHGLITYASKNYWEEAYAGKRYGDSFEWYGAWEEQDTKGHSLATLVQTLVKGLPSTRTLVLGCGNSNMSAILQSEGHRPVVSVDISDSVIQQMQDKYSGLEGMEWRTMDISKLSFDDGSFDFAIEKGLFDALFAGTGGDRLQAALAEVARVLRPGAHFVSVSFSADRMGRLFEASSALLDCGIHGEMTYLRRDRANSSSASNESEKAMEEHHIYVYACKRRD